MSIRASIMGGACLARAPFECPGVGEVYLRELSGAAREEFEVECARRGDLSEHPEQARGLRAFLVVRSLCEPDGTLVFQADEVSDLEANISGAALDALADEVMARNKLRDGDVEGLAGK